MMDSLGHGNAPTDPRKTKSDEDFDYAGTQVFDSHFSPPPSPGENFEDGNNGQLHFYDTVPVEEAYDTQVVGDYETEAWNLGGETEAWSLGGETQAWDLGGETQAVYIEDETQKLDLGGETQAMYIEDETQKLDLGGETQALDYFDDIENLDTHLLDVFNTGVLNESDNVGSDRTEVMGDGESMSDDDSTRKVCNLSLEEEKKQCTSIGELGEKDSKEQRDALNLGSCDSTATPVLHDTLQSKSGSVPRFTSIRVASLRASGLTARSMASKEISIDGTSSDHQDAVRKDGSESKIVEAPDNLYDLKDSEKEDGLRNGYNCRVGSSTARKLFTEDSVSEEKSLPHSGGDAAGGENFSVNDYELAGLSYVDSQEPGEFTQANALTFVELFIEKNKLVEFDQDVDHGKSTGGKSKPISTAKGPQSLAKKSNRRSEVGAAGIYDWDDSREDEGGGDIFCRRKDEFFGTACHVQRSLTEPQRLKERKSDLNRDAGEETDVSDRMIMQSDSRVTLHTMKKYEKKAEEAQRRVEKNLLSELDEEINANSSIGQLEATAGKPGIPQMLTVGPDTQMVAEAMEALLSGEGVANNDVNGLQSNCNCSAENSYTRTTKKRVSSKLSPLQNRVCLSGVGVTTRQTKKTKSCAELSKCPPVSSVTKFKIRSKKYEREPVLTNKRRGKSMAEQNFTIYGSKNVDKVSSEIIGERYGVVLKSSRPKEFNDCLESTTRNLGRSIKKQKLAKVPCASTPIAFRTRRSTVIQIETTDQVVGNFMEGSYHLMEFGTLEENVAGSKDFEASEMLNLKKQRSNLRSNQSGELENIKPCQPEKSDLNLTSLNNGFDGLRYPRGRRSCRNLSGQVSGCDKSIAQPMSNIQPEGIRQSIIGHKRSRSNASSTCINIPVKRKTRSSVHASDISSSLDWSLEGKMSEKKLKKPGQRDAVLDSSSADLVAGTKSTKQNHSDGKIVLNFQPFPENAEVKSMLDKSPRQTCKESETACTSPGNCTTPAAAASPVCMGNDYFNQSCKKNLSKSCLVKEIKQLIATEPEPISPMKDLRKRRDMASIRVLFSHHLDEDIIKQQKKILDRLEASEVISMTDATHFVTDKFVRTRNMLEAIASGKPVVTHLWLESIAQVKIHIDEEAYLLRDTKKEKEFGFNMPISLARARKHPLLQGRRVVVTPNIKPSKETVTSLVKAVHGQAVERIGRSALKDDKVPDDLLILSCEEDYKICEPFLEKGAAVYSSELLLNGIVTQKLEYARHHLFLDNVKRTRSTIWLRKDDRKFHPVVKLK